MLSVAFLFYTSYFGNMVILWMCERKKHKCETKNIWMRDFVWKSLFRLMFVYTWHVMVCMADCHFGYVVESVSQFVCDISNMSSYLLAFICFLLCETGDCWFLWTEMFLWCLSALMHHYLGLPRSHHSTSNKTEDSLANTNISTPVCHSFWCN